MSEEIITILKKIADELKISNDLKKEENLINLEHLNLTKIIYENQKINDLQLNELLENNKFRN